MNSGKKKDLAPDDDSSGRDPIYLDFLYSVLVSSFREDKVPENLPSEK